MKAAELWWDVIKERWPVWGYPALPQVAMGKPHEQAVVVPRVSSAWL